MVQHKTLAVCSIQEYPPYAHHHVNLLQMTSLVLGSLHIWVRDQSRRAWCGHPPAQEHSQALSPGKPHPSYVGTQGQGGSQLHRTCQERKNIMKHLWVFRFVIWRQQTSQNDQNFLQEENFFVANFTLQPAQRNVCQAAVVVAYEGHHLSRIPWPDTGTYRFQNEYRELEGTDGRETAKSLSLFVHAEASCV